MGTILKFERGDRPIVSAMVVERERRWNRSWADRAKKYQDEYTQRTIREMRAKQAEKETKFKSIPPRPKSKRSASALSGWFMADLMKKKKEDQ